MPPGRPHPNLSATPRGGRHGGMHSGRPGRIARRTINRSVESFFEPSPEHRPTLDGPTPMADDRPTWEQLATINAGRLRSASSWPRSTRSARTRPGARRLTGSSDISAQLGFDEAWFSGTSAARDHRLARCSSPPPRSARAHPPRPGVVLPYHHPFMLADRMVLLDHGAGTSCSASAGALLRHLSGHRPGEQRDMMEESWSLRLWRAGRSRWRPIGSGSSEARLRLRPLRPA
jgi:hypothetical protein